MQKRIAALLLAVCLSLTCSLEAWAVEPPQSDGSRVTETATGSNGQTGEDTTVLAENTSNPVEEEAAGEEDSVLEESEGTSGGDGFQTDEPGEDDPKEENDNADSEPTDTTDYKLADAPAEPAEKEVVIDSGKTDEGQANMEEDELGQSSNSTDSTNEEPDDEVEVTEENKEADEGHSTSLMELALDEGEASTDEIMPIAEEPPDFTRSYNPDEVSEGNRILDLVRNNPNFNEEDVNWMSYFIFESGFRAMNSSSGSVKQFPYPNDGIYPELNDMANGGKYTRPVGGGGCYAYSTFVSHVIYNDNSGSPKKDAVIKGQTITAEHLKEFIQTQLQPGEQIRSSDPAISNTKDAHSVTFVAYDDNGFYFLNYPGEHDPYIRLQYAEWQQFADYHNAHKATRGLWIYNSDNTINSATTTPIPTPPSSEEIAAGKYGENVTWTLDKNGTLTLSGIGDVQELAGGDRAPWYDYKYQIKTVVFEQGITSIPSNLFYQCTAAERVILPKSVERIEEFAFYDCSNLTSIEVDAANPDFSSYEGVLFNKNKVKMYPVPKGKTGIFEIPYGVQSIGDLVFAGSKLSGLVIPASVSTIEVNAFQHNPNLTTVFFKGNAPYLRNGSFNQVEATVFYPHGNETWKTVVGNDYGGKLTWVEYTPAGEGVFYQIIEGENQSVNVNDNLDMLFEANIDITNFTGVLVDGLAVAKRNYTATAGSTIVKLRAYFLRTLEPGEHILTILANDGRVEVLFTITKDAPTSDPEPERPPATDDPIPNPPSGSAGDSDNGAVDAAPANTAPADNAAPATDEYIVCEACGNHFWEPYLDGWRCTTCGHLRGTTGMPTDTATKAAKTAYHGTIPQTADEFPLGGAIAVFGISLAGLAAMLLLRKKQR